MKGLLLGDRIEIVRARFVLTEDNGIVGEKNAPGQITIDSNGNVSSIETNGTENDREIDAVWALPGFVDIHCHGYGEGGEDVLDFWTKPERTTRKMTEFGVTTVIATITVPSSPSLLSKTMRACRAIEKACRLKEPDGAAVRGIHAEGPIIATNGGLPSSSAISNGYNLRRFEALLDDLGPCVRIMTISPSLEAGTKRTRPILPERTKGDFCIACASVTDGDDAAKEEAIRQCTLVPPPPFARLRALLRRGIVPALGHDKLATLDEIVRCLRCAQDPDSTLSGPFHLTHAFNVMAFHHRNCGLANMALLRRLPTMPIFEGVELPTVEVIADGRHVHPLTLQALLDAREHAAAPACIVSDAIAAPNAAVNTEIRYAGTRRAWVRDDPLTGTRSVVDERGILCGSCQALSLSFVELVRTHGLDVPQASKLVSTNPARVARIDDRVGTLRRGKRADIALLDAELSVVATIVGGRVAYVRNGGESD